jgi:hypothetical protein
LSTVGPRTTSTAVFAWQSACDSAVEQIRTMIEYMMAPGFDGFSAGWHLRMPLAPLRTHQVATSCNMERSQNSCRDLDHSAAQQISGRGGIA